MAKSTMATFTKISAMAWVSSSGRMAENTKENGREGNSTALVYIETTKGKSAKVSGSMAGECNGSLDF